MPQVSCVRSNTEDHIQHTEETFHHFQKTEISEIIISEIMITFIYLWYSHLCPLLNTMLLEWDPLRDMLLSILLHLCEQPRATLKIFDFMMGDHHLTCRSKFKNIGCFFQLQDLDSELVRHTSWCFCMVPIEFHSSELQMSVFLKAHLYQPGFFFSPCHFLRRCPEE